VRVLVLGVRGKAKVRVRVRVSNPLQARVLSLTST